jgi:hypothetical protein
MRQRNTDTNSKCNPNGDCHPDTNADIYPDCNPDAQTSAITQTSPDVAASANTAMSVRFVIRRQV